MRRPHLVAEALTGNKRQKDREGVVSGLHEPNVFLCQELFTIYKQKLGDIG